MRSGPKSSSRQPQPFIRTVPSGLELECDSMLEMGEISVSGLFRGREIWWSLKEE